VAAVLHAANVNDAVVENRGGAVWKLALLLSVATFVLRIPISY
jgi:hypothetical protein